MDMKNFLVLVFVFFRTVLVSAIVDLPNNVEIPDHNLLANIKTDFVVSIIAEVFDDAYGVRVYLPVCGASIISEDYVVTSADCFYRRLPEFSRESMNRLVAGSAVSKVGGSLHLIEETILHQDYYPSSYDYRESSSDNIALVKVTPPFDLRSHSKVNKIALNADNLLVAPSLVFMGWGATEFLAKVGYKYPEKLQLTKFDVISNDYCNKYGLDVNISQMCAQGYVGKGVCKRDTGSPLVFASETAPGQVKFKLVGIATDRHSCGNGYPDVYTKVDFFLQWINETCGCIVSF